VNAFDLWKEGIEKGIFMPQFHGREHLNVNVWMKALKEGNVRVHTAFENEMWGIPTAEDNEILIELQAAFDFIDPKDLIDHEKIILSGLDLFEKLFGYRATCFVPPNGPFSSRLEASCFSSGIKMIMVPRFRKEPVGYGKRLMRIHWLGQNSKTGLRYYTRNCLFEPARPGFDWVKGCLNQISVALRWHKPAIISSHRMNYIGSLYPENRQNGLNQLAALLENILCIWPDVEFVSSGDLVKIMSDE
jgi:hypothetical protein